MDKKLQKRIYARKYRKENLEIVHQYKIRDYKRKRQWFQELKSLPCDDCKKKYPHYIMDFDHVPEYGKKKSLISIYRSSWKDLFYELFKCDLVCSNCHRIRTWRRNNG